MTWPPLREELRGIEPYGAPQLDVPVQLKSFISKNQDVFKSDDPPGRPTR